ncbi:MAG TPA: DNA polymerase III subunit epsilon [Phenylobacterium sp.]|nr:DNA polymerase III subunit epsilon [Phenylobacterium sp.]
MRREIVLDTETTGLDPRSGHRLIEIACIELEDFVPTGRHFHCYIDPERDIDVDAERVHGISRAFLTGKPKFADREVVEAFLDFIEDSPLIAHNAPFDRGFLNHELTLCQRLELAEHRWIDTLKLAQAKFPGMYNSLDALCKRFKISLADREKHGALIDTRLLAEVYLQLSGGRERALDLTPAAVAIAVSAARQGAYGARPRPLPMRSTDEERARHLAFMREQVGDVTLWEKFGL